MTGTIDTTRTDNADDLRIFLDIVELVNRHSDEDALIEAVLVRLDQMKASGGLTLRKLDVATRMLEPCPIRATDANPDGLLANAPAGLRELLVEVPVELDETYDGLALLNNETVLLNGENIPDIELNDRYAQQVRDVYALGCKEAIFFSVHAAEPIGVLALYTIGDMRIDPRRAQLLERAAHVLAFGIEKCRALQRVAEQRKELETANSRLVESNRDLEDFAYVASHDLQEPLRKIQAFGDRLESKAGDRLTGESRENLQRMRDASQRMQILIHDLLRFSRVSSSALKPAPTSLESIINEVVASHRRPLDEAEGSFRIVNDIPAMTVDAGQFEQLFDTLIGNSIKYRQPVKDLTIEVEYHATDPDFHHISVSDNGIGFEQRYAERVFEPFKRLHSTADYEGSGIGLAICRRILDRHEGSITVESEPGEGSKFSVWLPKGAC